MKLLFSTVEFLIILNAFSFFIESGNISSKKFIVSSIVCSCSGYIVTGLDNVPIYSPLYLLDKIVYGLLIMCIESL